MSAKPEWEVLADLALRRLEKDYERTLQAKPVVRIKEFKVGDIVSLADLESSRYPIKLLSPEAAVLAFPNGVKCPHDRLALSFAGNAGAHEQPTSGYAALHDGAAVADGDDGSNTDSSGDDWHAPAAVEGHSTYNVAFEWCDGSEDARAAAEVKHSPAATLDCDAIKKAMGSFSLPPSAVPAWAAAVPERVWVSAVKEAALTGKDVRAVIQGMSLHEQQ